MFGWRQSAECSKFVDQMRLIVIATRCRDTSPVDFRFLSNESNYALKGAEPGKRLGRPSDAAIELAQQMFVTDPDRVRNLANPHRIQSTVDHPQGLTD